MKVVCLDGIHIWFLDKDNSQCDGPAPKEVCTIRWVGVFNEYLCLAFEEYPISPEPYDATQFRPVQDQYTEEEIEAVNIDELVEVELVEN